MSGVDIRTLDENLDPFLDAISGEIGAAIHALVLKHEHLLPEDTDNQTLAFCMSAILGRYAVDLGVSICDRLGEAGKDRIVSGHLVATMVANTCGCAIRLIGDPDVRTRTVRYLRTILDAQEASQ